MEHLFGELGLSVFTVLVEISVGIIFFEVFYNFKNGYINKKAVIVAILCAIIGSLSSLIHLGNPFHIYYAIGNLQTSWLSKEILSVSLFTFCLIVYLLFSLKKSRNIANIFAILSTLVGIFTLYAMSNVYFYSSVPFWHESYTYIEYYASAIALGAISFSLISNIPDASKEYVFLGAIAFVSAGILAISYVLHGLALADGNMVVQKSAEILYSYKNIMILTWITGGLSMFFYYSKNFFGFFGYSNFNSQIGSSTGTVSVFLLTISALLAKVIFYLAMQTSAIGLQ